MMSWSQPYLNTVRNFPVELSSEWSLTIVPTARGFSGYVQNSLLNTCKETMILS